MLAIGIIFKLRVDKVLNPILHCVLCYRYIFYAGHVKPYFLSFSGHTGLYRM